MNPPALQAGPWLLDGFARDVRDGLSGTPKTLPPLYFYDALGSALFDAICNLPWYEVTRAEKRLLERHAASVAAASGASFIAELGPGSGEKLALLAGAFLRGGRTLHAHLIDISPAALRLAEQRLAELGVTVSSTCATYEAGLRTLSSERTDSKPALMLMLGSNIGNFEPGDAWTLLAKIRAGLMPGDSLLLGTDLVKPAGSLQLAYDDPLGVTAAFNKNMLVRINRELDANFQLQNFSHRALWNEAASRIEMHLVAQRAQTVEIPGAGVQVHFAEGESVLTECSYKCDPAGVARLGERAGFRTRMQWVDEPGQFALTLFQVR